MRDKVPTEQICIPDYAFRLLRAASLVAFPPKKATPAQLNAIRAELSAAVVNFERHMPIVNGVVQLCDSGIDPAQPPAEY